MKNSFYYFITLIHYFIMFYRLIFSSSPRLSKNNRIWKYTIMLAHKIISVNIFEEEVPIKKHEWIQIITSDIRHVHHLYICSMYIWILSYVTTIWNYGITFLMSTICLLIITEDYTRIQRLCEHSVYFCVCKPTSWYCCIIIDIKNLAISIYYINNSR